MFYFQLIKQYTKINCFPFILLFESTHFKSNTQVFNYLLIFVDFSCEPNHIGFQQHCRAGTGPGPGLQIPHLHIEDVTKISAEEISIQT